MVHSLKVLPQVITQFAARCHLNSRQPFLRSPPRDPQHTRHTAVDRRLDVVFPDSMALRNDPFLANVEREFTFCEERVYYVVPHMDSDSAWFAGFDDALHFVSNAGRLKLAFARVCVFLTKERDGHRNNLTP